MKGTAEVEQDKDGRWFFRYYFKDGSGYFESATYPSRAVALIAARKCVDNIGASNDDNYNHPPRSA